MPTGASQYTLADDHPHRPGSAAPLETSRRVDKPRFDTLWGYAVEAYSALRAPVCRPQPGIISGRAIEPLYPTADLLVNVRAT
jgi:hypothetical protein